MSTRTDNFQHESSAHERLTRPKTTGTDQSARGSLVELYPVEVVTAWDGTTVIWRTIPTTSPASLQDYNSTLLCYNRRSPTTAVQRASCDTLQEMFCQRLLPGTTHFLELLDLVQAVHLVVFLDGLKMKPHNIRVVVKTQHRDVIVNTHTHTP